MKRFSLIIDGYNLIGTLHKDLEKAREELIEKLKEYSLRKGFDITLVFDGHRSSNLNRTYLKNDKLKIVYTGMGESADDYIMKTISTEKKQWIVLSSDRSIQKEAWAQRCIPIDSSVFMDILDKALRKNEIFIEREDELPPEVREKLSVEDRKPRDKMGNPMRLSKKERIVSKIIKEL